MNTEQAQAPAPNHDRCLFGCILVQHPESAGYSPLLPALLASGSGVFVALIGAWLAHHFTTRRDRAKAHEDAKRDFATRRADKREAIRKESVTRRIDAIEKLAAAVVSMGTDLDFFWERCTTPAKNIKTLDSPSEKVASALTALYFSNRIGNLWKHYKNSFYQCCHDALLYGLEIRRDPVNEADVSRAHEGYQNARQSLLGEEDRMLAAIEGLMPELVN